MPARFPRRSSLTIVGAVALAVAVANPVAAPPGDLDTTFSGDGKVTSDFASGLDTANGLVIQGNGKIVAAGSAVVSGRDDFALARYNTDGSLDSTFDSDGKVITDFASGGDQAHAVAIQADGKIVAAGFAEPNDFALARYNTDGSLDSTFDGDGKVTTDFATNDDRAFGVAIQGDGKIVAAGFAVFAGTFDFALARYNADGSLDSTFDGDGKVTTDFASGFDQASGVAIQGDGRIVAAGSHEPSSSFTDFALARYNTDGSLDSTFDGDGKVTTDFASSVDDAHALAIQGNGRILAAGRGVISGNEDFALARYDTDGSLDTTFDGDGRVTTDFPGNFEQASGVALQGNGKIVASGGTFASETFDFALARYNTDGSLDNSFSGDGKVTTDFAGDLDNALGVAIQGDGKIVAAGFAFVAGNTDFALARYACVRRTSRPMSIPICR